MPVTLSTGHDREVWTTSTQQALSLPDTQRILFYMNVFSERCVILTLNTGDLLKPN